MEASLTRIKIEGAYLLAALAAVMLFLSSLSPLSACLGFGLWWVALTSLRKHAFILSSVLFAAIQAVELSWMGSCEYQGAHMLILYMLVCLLIGLEFGLLTLLALKVKNIYGIFLIPAAWFLLEAVRYFWFCGFSWSYVGMLLGRSRYSLQLSSVIGVLGLSFFVMLTNALFFYGAQKSKKGWCIWALVAVFPYLFGFVRLSGSQQIPDKPQSIALVQTALLPSVKTPLIGREGDFISPYRQWEKILQLLQRANLSNPDLLVFPESTVCYTLDTPLVSWKKAEELFMEVFGEEIKESFPSQESPFAVSLLKEPMATNAFFMKTLSNFFHSEVIVGFDERADGKYFSSAFFCSNDVEDFQVHRKKILLPLAESLPFEWARPLAKYYGVREFFEVGDRSDLFKGKIPLGACICSEETFPYLMRERRKVGAKMFVNLSNDYWYPHSSLAYKHFALSKLRAVENGVFLLRSCNSGVTGVINPFGDADILLPYDSSSSSAEAGVFSKTIQPFSINTWYALLGDWPLGIFSTFCVSLWVFFIIKNIFLRRRLMSAD